MNFKVAVITLMLGLSGFAFAKSETKKAEAPAKVTKKKMSRSTAGVGDIGSSGGTDQLKCGGTEPFWGLTIQGKKMEYSELGVEKNKHYTINDKLVTAGFSEDSSFVLRGSAGLNKPIYVAIKAVECNDGMSDEVYSHEILYINGSTVLGGCCRTK